MIHHLLNPEPVGARVDRSALGPPYSPAIEAVAAAVREVLGGSRDTRRPVEGDVFAERLLSLRQAEALPEGIAEVSLVPGTVVTPLARDYLKRRGVSLRHVLKSELGKVGNRGEWGFAAGTETGVVMALRRALGGGAEGWRELGSFFDVTSWIVAAPGRGALYVTDDAPVAVWRACQVAGLRAAAAETCAAVDRAARRLGVNLLVVEPAGKPFALLRQMALTLRKGGAPAAPAGLEREGSPCGSPK